MGCGGSKAIAVVPSEELTPGPKKDPATAEDAAIDIVIKKKVPRDTKSGKSTASTDSGLGDVNESDAAVPGVPDAAVSTSGGLSFEIVLDAAPTKKKMPARLQALAQKPKKELTMLELHRVQQEADNRRRQALESVHRKAAGETRKVDHIAHKLTREKTNLGEAVDAKENRALENRQKHLDSLRQRLKAQEDRANRVRETKSKVSASALHSEAIRA